MNKKNIVYLALLSFFITTCNILSSNDSNEKELQILLPFEINDSWGYINVKGQIVIPPTSDYISAERFSENRGIVRTSSFGYQVIDQANNVITQNSFNRILPFSNGLALVYYANRYGFINLDGKIVIPIKYESATSFNNERALVTDVFGKTMLIDKEENQITLPDSLEYINRFDGLNEIDRVLIRKENKFGYSDFIGKIQIPLIYDLALPFSDGLASVRLDDEWFFINREGEKILSTGEIRTQSFTNDRSFLRNEEGDFALINKSGDVLTDYIFERGYGFQENRSIVEVGSNRDRKVIDKEGNIIFDTDFDLLQIPSFYQDGFLQISIRNSFGDREVAYIDTLGDFLIYPVE